MYILSGSMESDRMTGAFDDLNFLMASNNRLEVLQTIAERQMDRDDLVEATGTSAVTIGRITDDFGERNWIKREDGVFASTILGDIVAKDARKLERTVDIAQRFRPVGEYFTRSELDFDPHLLAHAEISVGVDDTAFDHVDRWTELFRQADDFIGITSHVPITLLDVLTEEIREHGMRVTGVFIDELVTRLGADPDNRTAFKAMIEAGATLYRDDGDWDFAIGIYDDERMSIAGFDEAGTPRLKIESDHPELREWAVTKYETIQRRATPLTVDDFDH